jgi:hypothetical protein
MGGGNIPPCQIHARDKPCCDIEHFDLWIIVEKYGLGRPWGLKYAVSPRVSRVSARN